MFTNICIEGIDKSGKGTVAEYVKRLSNHKYTVYDRGIISEMTYSRIFQRNQEFDLIPYERFVFVYLVVDEIDWNIRCKMTNEPAIDYMDNLNEFNKTVDELRTNGYRILEFNSSNATPYKIALDIISYMDDLNSNK